MSKKKIIISVLVIFAFVVVKAGGITDMTGSKYVCLKSTDINSVKWTSGFWAERFVIFSDNGLYSMWNTWSNPDISHGFRNFEIAAGRFKGEHWGPPFHDGDFYKWLEGVASVYAVTKDKELDMLMDSIIECISEAQRPDGYIHTPVIIAEKNKGIDHHSKPLNNLGMKLADQDDAGAFADRLNFETYNLGHLMTAGVVHYRATGKTTLLDVAIKAADFLCNYCDRNAEELAGNAICPSHYMGVVELYRTTGNKKYLKLAEELVNIRKYVKNGTDHNQDRQPFRLQKKAVGHAVRANYLYAGVADLYAETGEKVLEKNLESIWEDIVDTKMYITGGCGALYDGVSPDGTSYNPDTIQQIHQSYGRPYQLPNITAHNESCANIGNMLFNWRMFCVTGESKYMDVVETCLYNSILSAVSLDGEKYFYTNPLRISKNLPYTLRWSKQRTKYISCFCCPPNVFRTICEVQDYVYSVSGEGIYCNLYSGCNFSEEYKGGKISITQETNYPWSGDVKLLLNSVPGGEFSVFLRIPSWCNNYKLYVNGKAEKGITSEKGYAKIERNWNNGDKVELKMDMPAVIVESNPLVEENVNQVAVKRGPVVYCLEGVDAPDGDVDDIVIPANAKFKENMMDYEGSHFVSLSCNAYLKKEKNWGNTLYREYSNKYKNVKISMVPYYAWGNRGKCDMKVWLPVSE